VFFSGHNIWESLGHPGIHARHLDIEQSEKICDLRLLTGSHTIFGKSNYASILIKTRPR